MLGVLVAAAVIAVGGFVVTGNATKEPGQASCEDSIAVRLAASPDIAPAIGEAARDLEKEGAAVDGLCVDYDVQPVAPEQVAEVLASEPEDSPDLWAPDLSVWLTRAELAGAEITPVSDSMASSPVVVVGPNGQEPSSWQEVGMNTVAYLDPLTSSASTVALLSAFGEMAVTGASETEMGAMMVPLAQRYGAQPDKPETPEDVARAAAEGTFGVLTEQQLVSLQKSGVGRSLEATVPSSGTMLLDYPLASLSADPAVEDAGRQLAAYLSSSVGGEILAANGFREANSKPLDSGEGLGSKPYASLPSPAAEQVSGALRQWAVLTVPSRLLTVVDVSGSMDFTDAGTTRISLAVTAAQGALQLFPDNAEIGLWAFSERLGEGSRDYVPLAPVETLSATSGGATHREQLAAALKKLPGMTDGGTGLYDTALAAIRTLQDDYEARAVNSVILLTDGENEDPGSLSLDELVQTIERERDPARPIQVIAIGMGPDADAKALRKIAAATGGRSYVARNPEDISEVFIDAMLAR
ncbi:MAG TPA: substrate-binding domain-containing protein [Nocardioidaceae bacterium]|nr:substrate-binding domain-containing protein [Nocardioidaceae bacterium]